MTVMNSSPDAALLMEGIRVALDNMPRATLVIDEAGRVRLANRQALRQFGRLEAGGVCALSELPCEEVMERVRRAFRSTTPAFIGLQGPEGTNLTFSGWRLGVPGPRGEALAMLQYDQAKSLAARFLAVSQEAADHRERLADSLQQQRRLHEEAQRLRQLSATDRMTGLLNPVEFRLQAGRMISEIGVGLACVTFAYLDLDDFKQVNDRFGHLAGDMVIRAIAHILKRAVRAGDIVGRMGGDEFMMGFANAQSADISDRMSEIADRIRQPMHWNPPDGTHSCLLATSASIGVFTVQETDMSFESVLRNAEAGMYGMKRQSRSA